MERSGLERSGLERSGIRGVGKGVWWWEEGKREWVKGGWVGKKRISVGEWGVEGKGARRAGVDCGGWIEEKRSSRTCSVKHIQYKSMSTSRAHFPHKTMRRTRTRRRGRWRRTRWRWRWTSEY